jgi:chemotaxis protein methyltransferase CheR
MSTTQESLRYVRAFVLRRSAIVVEPGKEYLVESRLGALARAEGLGDVDALVRRVRSDESGPLARRLVEAMTTNETSFFRDVHPWEALGKTMLPALLAARAAGRRLRIWCAAASTGQEPYTIAMVLREAVPDIESWQIEIVATDINASVLARAKEGVFKQLEVNRGLPAAMLVKYFERTGADFRVKPELRDLVTFRELNLVDRAPLPYGNDVVFMRNVLIYFDVETKRRVLSRVHEVLAHDGYLVLGGAETTINVIDCFETTRVGSTIVYRPVVARREARDAAR